VPDRLARIHGLYYLATGLFPLVSIRLFEAITGPKRDRWLVRTVGALAAVIGAVLLRSRGRVDRALPVGSAVAFAGVDIIGTIGGVLRPVYLVDGLIELVLAVAWSRARRVPPPGQP
jgi:hypothetical protein